MYFPGKHLVRFKLFITTVVNIIAVIGFVVVSQVLTTCILLCKSEPVKGVVTLMVGLQRSFELDNILVRIKIYA
jgi:hypothetical protein